IAVCGIICGCDGPTAIHRWARHRESWLALHLALPNGIPSRDCIRRLLVALKPEAFQRCFQAWIADAIPSDADTSGRLVAIDGKTCCGSRPLRANSARGSADRRGVARYESVGRVITAVNRLRCLWAIDLRFY